MRGVRCEGHLCVQCVQCEGHLCGHYLLSGPCLVPLVTSTTCLAGPSLVGGMLGVRGLLFFLFPTVIPGALYGNNAA